ncbi:MAG TPA: phage minor capsid protein, partial [Candidatus Nitrosocosmicus sp.]
MSRLTKKQIDDITPDIVYYNIIITPERDRSRTLAVYEETRVEPIINNPNDYYMSIVRFSIDGSWIPLFIAPVVPNPLNPQDANLMPYLFSLTYLGTMYNVNVVYIPENNARIPNAPYLSNGLIIQDVSTNYYFVYYYTTLINLLNTAIYKAFYGYTDPFLVPIPPHHVNGLFDDYPDLPGISTPIPYYIYDPVI